MDYHRSSSFSDEHGGESRSGGYPYYNRSVSGASGGGGEHWAESSGGNRGGSAAGGGGVGGAYTPTGPPGGGRAARDGNWRSPSTSQAEEKTPTSSDWGSHWHPPPSPSSKLHPPLYVVSQTMWLVLGVLYGTNEERV